MLDPHSVLVTWRQHEYEARRKAFLNKSFHAYFLILDPWRGAFPGPIHLILDHLDRARNMTPTTHESPGGTDRASSTRYFDWCHLDYRLPGIKWNINKFALINAQKSPNNHTFLFLFITITALIYQLWQIVSIVCGFEVRENICLNHLILDYREIDQI